MGRPRRYLTRYKRPSEATPLDRLSIPLACRFVLVAEEPSETVMESFFRMAHPLLVWNRAVLEELMGTQLSASLHECAEFCSADPDDLLSDSSFRSEVLEPLRLRKRLRTAWIRATICWIDHAGARAVLPMQRNLRSLAHSLSLDSVQSALVSVVAFTRYDERLLPILRGVKCESRRELARRLATALELPFERVLKSLDPDGPLARLGLIDVHPAGDLEDVTRAANINVYERLHQPFNDVREFLSSFLKRAAPTHLTRDDFEHLSTQLDIAKDLIVRALKSRQRGVNILLYGEPGTGKTEFARLIAKELNVTLVEADCETEDGSTATMHDRLSALLLSARALTSRADAFILFDEAEDAFPGDGWGPSPIFPPRKPAYSKAWMNRLLESLPTPVIWVTNSVEAMDPAYLRRFLLHIRFPDLPAPAKQRLAERYLRDLRVTSVTISQIARLPGLTPAHLESASRVARLCRRDGVAVEDEIVQRQIRAAREAVGLDSSFESGDLPVEYRSDYVHLREPMSVAVLLEALHATTRAAVCFYGQPGTGKTQLAHFLAQQLGREVIEYSASDLLSSWVGMTEKNIARMFASGEDRPNDVLILLDEADTFLSDRRMARASWQVTQTNEFLARMERYSGIFVCTTNLVDALDPAVLRRFLFRAEFLPITLQQCVRMFEASFSRPPSKVEQDGLRQMSGLVPADFANSARRLRSCSALSRVNPTALLAEELRARRGYDTGSPIGFAAQI